MMKKSQGQCLEVCNICLSALNDPKYYAEKNLFRSNVSQTEVRALQSRMISKDGKWKETDPHILAEVLQTSLRDMNPPLLHEVYGDVIGDHQSYFPFLSYMLTTDNSSCNSINDIEMTSDDNYINTKMSIQKWIVKLPEASFNLV